MLNTDLNGFISNLKRNDIFNLFILLGICSLLYIMLSMCMKTESNFKNFSDTYSLYDTNGMHNVKCNRGIPKIDEAIIRNAIEFNDRNPAMLTSSMVVPEPPKPSDEVRRKTKMDIMNMFYSSFDDDLTTIKSRPQNLYIIP
jgi:hypothetical protein